MFGIHVEEVRVDWQCEDIHVLDGPRSRYCFSEAVQIVNGIVRPVALHMQIILDDGDIFSELHATICKPRNGTPYYLSLPVPLVPYTPKLYVNGMEAVQ